MTESQPSWEIMIAKQPEKTLRRLPQGTFEQVNQAILALAQNPHPLNRTNWPGMTICIACAWMDGVSSIPPKRNA